MSRVESVLNAIFEALFPRRCVGCGEIITTQDSFCDYCFEMLPKTNVDNLCEKCGCIKKECQCKYNVFHFSRFTAPFYNDGPAKSGMYAFKFRRKLYFADAFAEQMALSVKNNFFDVKFDAVTFVPMTPKKELQRGYNQSYELAVRIAKILNLPLVHKALGCNAKKTIQHKTDFKDRFENVKGVYYPNVSLSGKTILLVDDIKTTGATLNECAKALLKAGALDVYCVTGLITKRKKKVDKDGN